ncbi:Hypothetical protein NGAL_HAMBI490_50220 [Neorhizobium galegae bv. officinalis]|nr:Hypothetical protein NGAL_HAMBI490_50220 [Neorhizobium galegae bv. officinalis]
MAIRQALMRQNLTFALTGIIYNVINRLPDCTV